MEATPTWFIWAWCIPSNASSDTPITTAPEEPGEVSQSCSKLRSATLTLMMLQTRSCTESPDGRTAKYTRSPSSGSRTRDRSRKTSSRASESSFRNARSDCGTRLTRCTGNARVPTLNSKGSEEFSASAKKQWLAVKMRVGEIPTAVQKFLASLSFTARAPVAAKARPVDSGDGTPMEGSFSSLSLAILSSGSDTNPADTKNFRFLIASDREGVLIASRIRVVSNFFCSSA
jgi:hypothetical protein